MSSPSGGDATAQSAERQWARIIAAVRTPAQHAAVMDVRSRFGRVEPPPHADMVRVYQAITKAGTYASLNGVGLTAVPLADLGAVVKAAAAGLPVAAIEGTTREALTRARLVTVDQSRGLVVATRAGVAVLRGAYARPVRLTESDAYTLALLDVDRGRQVWPGTAACLRACTFWNLTTWTGTRYQLTVQGSDALARHRGSVGLDTRTVRGSGPTVTELLPNEGQVEILEHLTRTDDPEDLVGFTKHHVAQAVTRGWLIKAGSIRPSGRGAARALYRITASGRDALGRAHDAQRRNGGRLDTPTVGKIEPGAWIRLVNWRQRRMPEKYVLLVRKEETVVPGTMKNHGWELWVVDAEGQEPYLYGGRPFYPAAKCQVRESQTAVA